MNSIRPTTAALTHDLEADGSAQSHDVHLANELLRVQIADEVRPADNSKATSNASEDLIPLSKDDFKSILDAAQHLKNLNELNDFKKQQEQYTKTGKLVADALVEENDTVSPVAQARILEVYQIPLDIFRQAKEEMSLGESQNNSREELAQKLGLPASASRGFILAEQAIAGRCEEVKGELNKALSVLELASAGGVFRHDVINDNGVLRLPLKVSGISQSKLFIDAYHIDDSVEYPGLTNLEYARNILSNIFRASGDSYAQKKLATYDITFPAAIEMLRENSPSFEKFLQELPESVEVVGEINTRMTGDDHRGWTALSIQLYRFEIEFRLKGYAESSD